MLNQIQLSNYIQLDWREWKTPIAYALAASVVLHIFFLAFKWHSETEKERRLKTPLSVVLVNARSQQAPANPKRLAQADLNGGGELKDSYATALRRADPQLAQQLKKCRLSKSVSYLK